jgi:SWI/SNF-related matrix-associated actin-dependent regulator of chromatin subfamily A-like protein 1
MNLRIHREKNKEIYILDCKFTERDIARKNGFEFSGTKSPQYIPVNVWYTKDISVAKLFYSVAEDELKKLIDEFEEKIKKSSLIDRIDIDIPCPKGLEYKNYQRAGIAYALSRKHTIIADEMGLGKSIQAIGYMNANIQRINKVLILCPASLKINWQRECQKWLVRKKEIQIIKSSTDLLRSDASIYISNYELLTDPKIRQRNEESDREYDERLLNTKSVKTQLFSIALDLLILDEAHYIKNPNSQRAIAVLGKSKSGNIPAVKGIFNNANNVIALTGTPVQNNPIEIFPLLHAMYPKVYSSYWTFAQKYHGAHQKIIGHPKFGKKVWALSEPQNLDHLQETLRSTCMIRRLKEDVLKELPPKIRSIVVIEPEEDKKLKRYLDEEYEIENQNKSKIISIKEKSEKIEEEIKTLMNGTSVNDDRKDKLDELKKEYDKTVNDSMMYMSKTLGELQSERAKMAEYKLPSIYEHIDQLLEDGHKAVVFCVSHSIIDKIMAKYKDISVKIDGRDSQENRQKSVDLFQNNTNTKIFVGNIKAAGVGLTLTKASHVIFAELDWVPANIYQAEDRCHRMGQKDIVFVYHYVLEGSFDETFIKVIVNKQNIFDKMLDLSTERDLEEEIVKTEYLIKQQEVNEDLFNKEMCKKFLSVVKGIIFGDEKNRADILYKKDHESYTNSDINFIMKHAKNRIKFFEKKYTNIIENFVFLDE